MSIPKRVESRLCEGLKRFQTIVQGAVARDVNETDTVTIVKDFCSEILGYDKYTELTSEYSIRGTYCDLAIKIENKVVSLIEIKAVGIELKENHIKQAVDYATNLGSEWAILTNSNNWKIFKIHFKQPIEAEMLYEFNILDLDCKKEDHLEKMFMLSKEGLGRGVLDSFFTQKRATNKYILGAILSSDIILKLVRKELKKLNDDIKVDLETIETIIKQEVIKREILESSEFQDAQKKISRKKRLQNRTNDKLDETKKENLVPPQQ